MYNVLKREEHTTLKTESPTIKQQIPLGNAAHSADPRRTVSTGLGNLTEKIASYMIKEVEHIR